MTKGDGLVNKSQKIDGIYYEQPLSLRSKVGAGFGIWKKYRFITYIIATFEGGDEVAQKTVKLIGKRQMF